MTALASARVRSLVGMLVGMGMGVAVAGRRRRGGGEEGEEGEGEGVHFWLVVLFMEGWVVGDGGAVCV